MIANLGRWAGIEGTSARRKPGKRPEVRLRHKVHRTLDWCSKLQIYIFHDISWQVIQQCRQATCLPMPFPAGGQLVLVSSQRPLYSVDVKRVLSAKSGHSFFAEVK